jgi:hypothetical protein
VGASGDATTPDEVKGGSGTFVPILAEKILDEE